MSSVVILGTLLSGCLVTPELQTVKAPNELDFNYWLLNTIYLWPEDLKNKTYYQGTPSEADSFKNVSAMYQDLKTTEESHGRYTHYTPPIQAPDVIHNNENKVAPGSLGFEFRTLKVQDRLTDSIVVRRVFNRSPAETMGLKNGDILVSINDSTVSSSQDYSSEQDLLNRTAGDSNTVEILVLRNDSLQTLNGNRGAVAVPTVYTDTLSEIPYIRITGFLSNPVLGIETDAEFREALVEMTGAPLIILDLRANLGGYVHLAMAVADEIIASGLMGYGYIKYPGADTETYADTLYYEATSGGAGENSEFIILTDYNTASASEILIAALKHNRGFKCIGEPTRGKGVGQQNWRTPAGGLAVITSLQFFYGNGLSWNEVGFTPDISAPRSESINKALEYAGVTTKLGLQKKWNPFLSNPDINALPLALVEKEFLP
jgi:C-terminal peptidase prc